MAFAVKVSNVADGSIGDFIFLVSIAKTAKANIQQRHDAGVFGMGQSREMAVKKRGREKKEGLNEVDVFVGQRLRELRMLAGLSQSDVAAGLGLTFQQLQKYERGFNRVSASRLYKLAQFFRVPVSVFFEGLESQVGGEAGAGAPATETADASTLHSREALMLARYFQSIRDPQVRHALRELAERCAVDEDPLMHEGTRYTHAGGRA